MVVKSGSNDIRTGGREKRGRESWSSEIEGRDNLWLIVDVVLAVVVDCVG